MKEKKIWLIISSISGFTAVAIGAFGGHGLGDKLSSEMLDIFKTGVFYQFVHTIVLLFLSMTSIIQTKIPSIFFLFGIILFSFSLYLYSISGEKFFTVITPVGGVFLLVGWLWLLIEAVRTKDLK